MSEENKKLLVGIVGSGSMAAIEFFAQNKFAHFELDWPAKAAVSNAFGISAETIESPELVNRADPRYGLSPGELLFAFQEWAKFVVNDRIWIDTADRAFDAMCAAPEMQELQGMTVSVLDDAGIEWVRERGRILRVKFGRPLFGETGMSVNDQNDLEIMIPDDDEAEQIRALEWAAEKLGAELDKGDQPKAAANG